MKKHSILILALMMAFSVCSGVACKGNGEVSSSSSYVNENVSISFYVEEISVEAYTTFTLSVRTEGSTKAVEFSSSNEDVATVSATGEVSTSKAGVAIITATLEGVTAECVVTVTETAAYPYLIVDRDSAEMVVGRTIKIVSQFFVGGAPIDGVITYSTSKPSVATVAEDGTITAVGTGSATIYVKGVCRGEVVEKTVAVIVKGE